MAVSGGEGLVAFPGGLAFSLGLAWAGAYDATSAWAAFVWFGWIIVVNAVLIARSRPASPPDPKEQR